MVRAAKSKIAQKEKNDLLYRAILTLKNEEECYSFFQDLCTISELRSMEQRYEVATLLNDGMLYAPDLAHFSIMTPGIFAQLLLPVL